MFWHGRTLSPLEITCMRSYIDHGHRLRVFSYDALALPAGVEYADARQILPYDRLFTFEGSPAAFACIFRYKLLFQEGGWWVDTDVLCRKADLPACDYYWAEQHPGQLNNAIMKFPRSDELCGRLLALSERRARRLSFWGQLGPALVTEVLMNTRPAGHAGSIEDAYPIHWLETHFFWLPEFAAVVHSRIGGSTFLHFWHSVFGRLGIDIEKRPPAGSFLDTLYETYGTNPPQTAIEAPNRDAIIAYLQQDWVIDQWCNGFKRTIEDLGIPRMLARKSMAARGAPAEQS